VGSIAATFPNWKPTTETIEAYSSLLADLDDELASQAVMFCLRNDMYAPPPARIREVHRMLEKDTHEPEVELIQMSADLTEEQRQENLGRIRKIMEGLKNGWT
jgi:hypothetical protein